ncbi:hypothetical protein AF332_18895 [Sporosarcina globispora]|uniref:Uncharacterized protein n=1 Tax=Sporosarcina globispora TaxID=1459 RepID=A0A0M0GFN9_SPOGL|nr:hypothetical protein AF332_18895 [Sporosarcina globispora]
MQLSQCSQTANLPREFALFVQIFVKRVEKNAIITITAIAKNVPKHALSVLKNAVKWLRDQQVKQASNWVPVFVCYYLQYSLMQE